MDTWQGISPGAITGYGGSLPGSGSGGVTQGVEGNVGTAGAVHPPLYSPDNPLFWFALVLALAGGLIYISTEVKAGPFKAGASI